MTVDKARIAALIPHAGAMCLLEEVTSWDATRIQSRSCTHHDDDNPLRHAGRLPALCAIEYAAQTMAVHGGLSGAVTSQPKAGYLVSLRDVACKAERLDNIEGDLIVDAELLAGDGERVMYEFHVQIGSVEVLTGRATVVLDAQKPSQ